MRDILFRGKMYNGEWIEGDLINTVRKEDERFRDAVMILGLEYERVGEYGAIRKHEFVRPETVGQYTGLKDKGGKRIFEGDIVFLANRFGKGLHWIVEWHNGTLSLKQGLCDYWACFEDMKGYTFEVVGNIHDEPELLGGDE